MRHFQCPLHRDNNNNNNNNNKINKTPQCNFAFSRRLFSTLINEHRPLASLRPPSLTLTLTYFRGRKGMDKKERESTERYWAAELTVGFMQQSVKGVKSISRSLPPCAYAHKV